MVARPERGRLRGVIEAVRVVEPRGHAVVVAANVDLAAAQRAHGVEDLVPLRGGAYEVAGADHGVDLLAADVREHGAGRLRVRMQIADDERSHTRLPYDFHGALRAASRTLFGSSSTIRSTLSARTSSSRISIVRSDMR